MDGTDWDTIDRVRELHSKLMRPLFVLTMAMVKLNITMKDENRQYAMRKGSLKAANNAAKEIDEIIKEYYWTWFADHV